MGIELDFEGMFAMSDKLPNMRIYVPEYVWALTIGEGFQIPVLKGKEPCWFHRKMQELVLGFKWKKLK